MARNRIARGTGSQDRRIESEPLVHARCSAPCDWERIAQLPAPVAPVPPGRERAARAELAAFRPSWLARLDGGARRDHAALVEQVREAAALDRAHHASALAAYRAAHDAWSARTRLARGVLALEPAACREALAQAGAFDGLPVRLALDALADRVATVSCVIEDAHPRPLDDERACAVAIRAAREAFAWLPVFDVIVNVTSEQRDAATGVVRYEALLAVYFAHEMMSELDDLALPPSRALASFPHRRYPADNRDVRRNRLSCSES